MWRFLGGEMAGVAGCGLLLRPSASALFDNSADRSRESFWVSFGRPLPVSVLRNPLRGAGVGPPAKAPDVLGCPEPKARAVLTPAWRYGGDAEPAGGDQFFPRPVEEPSQKPSG